MATESNFLSSQTYAGCLIALQNIIHDDEKQIFCLSSVNLSRCIVFRCIKFVDGVAVGVRLMKFNTLYLSVSPLVNRSMYISVVFSSCTCPTSPALWQQAIYRHVSGLVIPLPAHMCYVQQSILFENQRDSRRKEEIKKIFIFSTTLLNYKDQSEDFIRWIMKLKACPGSLCLQLGGFCMKQHRYLDSFDIAMAMAAILPKDSSLFSQVAKP